MCAPDTGCCNNFQLYLFFAFNALVRTSCYLELTTKVQGSITALECSEPRGIFFFFLDEPEGFLFQIILRNTFACIKAIKDKISLAVEFATLTSCETKILLNSTIRLCILSMSLSVPKSKNFPTLFAFLFLFKFLLISSWSKEWFSMSLKIFFSCVS